MGCGGGGETSTSYVQSPEARQLMQQLMPTFNWIFPGKSGEPTKPNIADYTTGGTGGTPGHYVIQGGEVGGPEWIPGTEGTGGTTNWDAYNKALEQYNTDYAAWKKQPAVNTHLYDIPSLNYNLPTLNTPTLGQAPSYEGLHLNNLPLDVKTPEYGAYQAGNLNVNLPTYQGVNAADYMPGGQQFENAYNKVAPSMWDAYNRNVENPLINRFAGSGTLGSPVAGLSGAAADVLADKRGQAGNAISSQAYQLAQNPLMQSMQGNQAGNLAQFNAGANAAMTSALTPYQTQAQYDLSRLGQEFGAQNQAALIESQLPWQAQVQNRMARNATEFGAGNQGNLAQFNAANQGALTQYGVGANAATRGAELPWQQTLQMMQYPYQILPGILGGSLPQPVTTSSSGGLCG